MHPLRPFARYVGIRPLPLTGKSLAAIAFGARISAH
jgi:hypothetical protein